MAPEQRRRLLEAHEPRGRGVIPLALLPHIALIRLVARAVAGAYRDGEPAGRLLVYGWPVPRYDDAGGPQARAAAASVARELWSLLLRPTPPATELPVVAGRLRDLARQRWLIRHTQRIEAQLRAGERPSARLINGLIRGLLAMRAGHRRDELRLLEQMAVDSGT